MRQEAKMLAPQWASAQNPHLAIEVWALDRARCIRGAEELAHIAADIEGARYAMIGGAPFFMARLERALRYKGVTPLYAFSRREVVEETRDDGATVKTAVFRHLGFVEA